MTRQRRGWVWRWSTRPSIVPFHYHDGYDLLDEYEARWVWFGNQLRNLWGWLHNAHDCQDPRVGCSCSGSVRFPRAAARVDLANCEGEGDECYIHGDACK